MAGDMMSTLKGLLGDNADEKIQSVLSALSNSNTGSSNTGSWSADSSDTPSENVSQNSTQTSTSTSNNSMPNVEALEYISKLKGMVDDMGRANDPRSTLLMSLKPYMRSGRQKSIA